MTEGFDGRGKVIRGKVELSSPAVVDNADRIVDDLLNTIDNWEPTQGQWVASEKIDLPPETYNCGENVNAIPVAVKVGEIQMDTGPDPDRLEQSEPPTHTEHLIQAAAFSTMEGGDHYLGLRIQPMLYCEANGLRYIESCVIKYMSRWRRKNGLQDLLKAKDCIEKLIALEFPGHGAEREPNR